MQQTFLFEPQTVNIAEIAPAKKVTLRPYQRDASQWVASEFETPSWLLVVLPTGTGKSVVFSEVMREFVARYTGRILLIAHRRELLKQAIGHSASAGLTGELEMAANTAGSQCEVVCASIDTLMSLRKCKPCKQTGRMNGEECAYCDGRGKVPRYEGFDPNEFGLVVIDEAHHAPAKTYRTALQWFGRNKSLRVLGVTATPKRGDGVAMSNVFQRAWNKMELPVALSEGWLVPLRQMFVRCDSLSLVNVRTRAGDFVEGDLAKAYLGGSPEEEHRLLHEVAFPVARECGGTKPFIVFAAGVEHTEKLTAAFNSYPELAGRVEMLLGKTDDDTRDAILGRLLSGQSIGLVNCGVCTEGFDLPILEIAAIARNTRSEGLFLQMIGRITRTVDGCVDGPETAKERRAAIASSRKPYGLVMLFCGPGPLSQQQTVGSVLSGLPLDNEDLIAANNAALKAETAADMERLITETREERLAKLEEQAKKLREKRERQAEERRVQASGIYADDGDYTADAVPMFGRDFDAFRDYQPEPDGATQKQVSYLVSLGVKPETAMSYTKHQAGAVITAQKAKLPPGCIVNKWRRKCIITNKMVAAGAGYCRRNHLGQWETISKEGIDREKRHMVAHGQVLASEEENF